MAMPVMPVMLMQTMKYTVRGSLRSHDLFSQRCLLHRYDIIHHLLDIDPVKNIIYRFDRVYDRILCIVWRSIYYISLIGRVGNEPSHESNINFGSARRGVVAYILQFSTSYSSNRNFRPNLLFSSSTQISRQKPIKPEFSPNNGRQHSQQGFRASQM